MISTKLRFWPLEHWELTILLWLKSTSSRTIKGWRFIMPSLVNGYDTVASSHPESLSMTLYRERSARCFRVRKQTPSGPPKSKFLNIGNFVREFIVINPKCDKFPKNHFSVTKIRPLKTFQVVFFYGGQISLRT